MKQRKLNWCFCGSRISKYAKECSACHRRKMDQIHEEVRRIVKTGSCPECGRALVRNLSMKGWWQCEQLGAEAFRKDPNQPPCHWQGFTE